MAGYFPGSFYAEITDNAALTLDASARWALRFFVYPDSSLSDPAFGYIYSHGQPLNFEPALNIIKLGTTNTIRVIVDWAGGNLFDSTTAISLNDDEWNTLIVAYDGTNLRVAINGTLDTGSPPALPDIDPSGNARIGYSVVGGTRNFPGAIAHAAKYDRNFGTTELTNFSNVPISPEFVLNGQAWHIPFFTDQVWDMRSVLTVTPQGMSWVPHGPFIYPARPYNSRGSGVVPVATERSYRYYREV